MVEVEYINSSGYIVNDTAKKSTYSEIAKIKNIRPFCSNTEKGYDLFVDDRYNMYVVEYGK